MKIIGKKVILRPLTEKDLPICFQWIHDSEVTKFLRFPIAKTMKEERAWFRELSKDPHERLFAIIAKDSKKFIGNMGIHQINRTHRNCWVGIFIGDKSYWNRGYGTDAMQTLVRYCFQNLKMHRISLTVLPKNRRAIRCYEKCGFKKEGLMKDETFWKGKYWDSYLMSVLKK